MSTRRIAQVLIGTLVVLNVMLFTDIAFAYVPFAVGVILVIFSRVLWGSMIWRRICARPFSLPKLLLSVFLGLLPAMAVDLVTGVKFPTGLFGMETVDFVGMALGCFVYDRLFLDPFMAKELRRATSNSG